MSFRAAPYLELVGQRFGRLVVIRFSHKDTSRNLCWECACDCGNTHITRGNRLKNGTIHSCGCLRQDVCRALSTKHGMSHTHTWNSWMGMLQRCNNINDKDFSNYGGRGITVCDGWMVFENFYKDMGPRPEGKSLDRIDVNGPYSPDNCRWATPEEQANNRRSSNTYTYNGETMSLKQWASTNGIKLNTLKNRVHTLKMPLELALTLEVTDTKFKIGDKNGRAKPNV